MAKEDDEERAKDKAAKREAASAGEEEDAIYSEGAPSSSLQQNLPLETVNSSEEHSGEEEDEVTEFLAKRRP